MPEHVEDRTGTASADTEEIEAQLSDLVNHSVRVYDTSIREKEGRTFAMVRVDGRKRLAIRGTRVPDFDSDSSIDRGTDSIYLCPCTEENAGSLREWFPWTSPEPVGYSSAIGCGDRLGLATSGHIRACRSADVVPILVQQSIREMERTGRSPQEVLDDVSWAVFQEGYTVGFGADADHLKTEADVDACLEAGYTMYTIDPSDHVQDVADELSGEELAARFRALPWDRLNTTPDKSLRRYTDSSIRVDGKDQTVDVEFSPESLKRVAVKYGEALAHTQRLAQYLATQYQENRPGEEYDLEMSVDETATPTRTHEHYFVALELERLGVSVTSLAPRFGGDFEKGIDYIGDVDAFEDAFVAHSIIAEAKGGYKLSIHSGSDKFSVFPVIGRHAGDRVHLKTAGTSFLEALHIPARHAPDFFREIVDFAFDRFEEDRKTYHVTTDRSVIPDPGEVRDEDLEEAYLEEDNGRQLLHITYGSILSAETNGTPRFRGRFFSLLDEQEEEHFEALISHFFDHIESVGHMTVRSDR